jgi:hypothetical protein
MDSGACNTEPLVGSAQVDLEESARTASGDVAAGYDLGSEGTDSVLGVLSGTDEANQADAEFCAASVAAVASRDGDDAGNTDVSKFR